MIPALVCLTMFGSSFLICRRSLPFGVLSVIASGYAYGIVRANLLHWMAHFTFDSSLLGCYLATVMYHRSVLTDGPRNLRTWLGILAAWPCLMALIPFQSPLITLVGLRGNIYFLPILLLGASLTSQAMSRLAVGIALLNGVALAFAGAEYVLGLERFFPPSPVTTIIYNSQDAGQGKYRIIATFANAHSYAGTMVATIPVLLGGLLYSRGPWWTRTVLVLGALSAVIGVLLAATRLNFVMMASLISYALLRKGVPVAYRLLLLAVIGLGGGLVATNERFSRFQSLTDSDTVLGRINGSVNRTFVEVLVAYPMGNGVGGGGTSIPHFLLSELRRPTSIESEYGRILLEQGIVGLLLWIAFIAFTISKGHGSHWRGWPVARRLCWALSIFVFGTAMIGTGLLTAIPGTFLWLLLFGWMLGGPADPARLSNQVAASMCGVHARTSGLSRSSGRGET